MSEENTIVEDVVTETVAPVVPEAAKVEVAAEPKTNPLAGFLAMKESNAVAFYGVIGGVSAIILTLLALGMGGDDEILKKANTQSIASGQKYTLKSPNAALEGGETLTVHLVSTPGAIAAFDDEDNKEECRKFPVGTSVTVLDKQQMSNVVYAKVQVDEGTCSGTIGWVLGINL